MTEITNATIIDGTGAPGFVGSVRLEGDRIVEVVPGEGPITEEAIDATGLVLAPGFIDVHTHDDAAVIESPEHACKVLQGVTSVVIGNCGFSPTPPGDGVLGRSQFPTMAEYLAGVEAAEPSVNVAALVGHGTIRSSVMGLRTRGEATEQQLAEMLDMLAQAFEDGAVGFSSGLAYEPGRYSPPSELHAFGEVAAKYGAIYTTHMRDEGDQLLESIDECVEVAEQQGIPLQISHLKATGIHNWGKTSQALERIDHARARGIDVMADQYPYTRGSTMLEQVVSGGALDDDGDGGFSRITPDRVLIANAPRNPHWEGQTITEIAEAAGVEPRAMADAIVKAEGRGCIVVLDNMSEDDVQEVLAHPAVMVGSDGIPMGGKAHPRLGHTYPRILGRYVREQELVELADIISRMTSIPARRFGFVDRGEVRAGAYADLVLFDPETILDTGTWTEPDTVPAGIAGVWVNGERVADGEALTGRRSGRVIRRS